MSGILGIDVSSYAIDMVLLQDEPDQECTWHRATLGDQQTPLLDRVIATRKLFPKPSEFDDHGIYAIAIEDPMSRFPHVAKSLGQVTGAVIARTPAHVQIIQTQPHEWRQLTGGKGAKKADGIRWAQTELGHTTWSDDAYEAYCIARAVRTLCETAAERSR